MIGGIGFLLFAALVGLVFITYGCAPEDTEQ